MDKNASNRPRSMNKAGHNKLVIGRLRVQVPPSALLIKALSWRLALGGMSSIKALTRRSICRSCCQLRCHPSRGWLTGPSRGRRLVRIDQAPGLAATIAQFLDGFVQLAGVGRLASRYAVSFSDSYSRTEMMTAPSRSDHDFLGVVHDMVEHLDQGLANLGIGVTVQLDVQEFIQNGPGVGASSGHAEIYGIGPRRRLGGAIGPR